MESIWGVIHDKKLIEFNEAVEVVESNCLEHLPKIIDKFGNEEIDKLSNQYLTTCMLVGDRYKYTIDFKSNSELPETIKKEVIDLFITKFSDN